MKKVIVIIEFIFGLIIGLFTVASLATFFGANYSSDFILSVFLIVVFENVVAPIFILIFIWRVIQLQLSVDKPNYLNLFLVIVSSLLLFNSWGLHSFEFWSSILCTAAVIIAIIGLMQIKTLRKSIVLSE